jgi:hypothetical protein
VKHNPLEELCSMLGKVHRAYLEQASTDPRQAAQSMDTHWLIRRLIEQQPANEPGDMHLLLEAAMMARDLDPDFSFSEAGSCISLLRKAVGAIERRHDLDAEAANQLLASIQRAT